MKNEEHFTEVLRYDRENRMLEAQIKHDQFKRKISERPRRKNKRKK